MKFLKSFFSNPKLPTSLTNIDFELEKSRLEGSLDLLRQSTNEVSLAAINTAFALEGQLKDVERRFYSTIDTIDDLVIIKDAEGRWRTVNRVGQELFGWCHGEYYMKTNEELAELYPQSNDTLLNCINSDRLAWDLRRSSRGEEYIPYGDSCRTIDIIKTPAFNLDGSRKELIIVGRDMTEILEKHRRNKACFHALNSASEDIVIIDSKARIVFSNDEFNRRFGIDDYTKVISMRMIDILPWLAKYDDLWQHARGNNSIKIATEEAGDILVMPMMNGQPKPIYFICTFKK